MGDELADDLDEYVAGADWPGDEPPPPPEDADGVNRLLRRVGRFERERAEIVAVADAELARIKAWRDDRVGGVERSIAFHARSLETWVRAHHEATGTKTVKLPNGQVAVRAGRARLMGVGDEEAVAQVFAVDHPTWARVTCALDKRALAADLSMGPVLDPSGFDALEEDCEFRAAVTEDGEVVDGVVFVCPTVPTFSYSTSKQTPNEGEQP